MLVRLGVEILFFVWIKVLTKRKKMGFNEDRFPDPQFLFIIYSMKIIS